MTVYVAEKLSIRSPSVNRSHERPRSINEVNRWKVFLVIRKLALNIALARLQPTLKQWENLHRFLAILI